VVLEVVSFEVRIMLTLMCVSDFPYTTPTVEFGGLIVELLESQVTLMTVRSPSQPAQLGDSVLDQAVEMLPIMPSKQLVCQGSVEDQILEELQQDAYNLVVVGASQQSKIEELFFGLITQRLVAQTDVSVLVVSHPRSHLKNILLATAGHDASDPTVKAGAKLAQLSGAKLTLVHVTGAWPGMYAGLSRIEETLPKLLQSETPTARHLRENIDMLRSLGIEAQLELRHGLPAEEIVLAANKHKYDLLVIGASKIKMIRRLLLDEVAPQIVNQAPCPVLVVRGQLDD
jgi:nucleotide-binding universal stress UspA family protein